MFNRHTLHSRCKGDLTIKVKGYCDNLASRKEVITGHEHVTAILNGLSPEYESAVTVIIVSQLPSSVQTITTLLLDAKAWMKSVVAEILSSSNMVTHKASGSLVDIDLSFSRGWGCGRMSSSHIQCQLCRKMGHLINRFYHQFDVIYKSASFRPPQEIVCMFGNDSIMLTCGPSFSSPMSYPTMPSYWN